MPAADILSALPAAASQRPGAAMPGGPGGNSGGVIGGKGGIPPSGFDGLLLMLAQGEPAAEPGKAGASVFKVFPAATPPSLTTTKAAPLVAKPDAVALAADLGAVVSPDAMGAALAVSPAIAIPTKAPVSGDIAPTGPKTDGVDVAASSPDLSFSQAPAPGPVIPTPQAADGSRAAVSGSAHATMPTPPTSSSTASGAAPLASPVASPVSGPATAMGAASGFAASTGAATAADGTHPPAPTTSRRTASAAPSAETLATATSADTSLSPSGKESPTAPAAPRRVTAPALAMTATSNAGQPQAPAAAFSQSPLTKPTAKAAAAATLSPVAATLAPGGAAPAPAAPTGSATTADRTAVATPEKAPSSPPVSAPTASRSPTPAVMIPVAVAVVRPGEPTEPSLRADRPQPKTIPTTAATTEPPTPSAAPAAAASASVATTAQAPTASPAAPAAAPAPTGVEPPTLEIAAETVDAPTDAVLADSQAATDRAQSAPSLQVHGGSHLSRATVETTALIAARILQKLDQKTTRFDMALTPEGMGTVDVSLDVAADGSVAARLAFDTPAAAAELRARADELRRQLEAAGFTLSQDALDFSARDGGSGAASNPFDRDHQAGSRRAFSGAGRLAEAADTAAASPAAWLSLRLAPEGVDVKV